MALIARVLILRHLQEMTYEEMTGILTMPIGTIKTHLFRARHLLKERLYNAFSNAR
jgi:RNA polymerase sigma-70 factor, ECF subfamily